MKPNIFAFIFARGGSKGVPRKNIKFLGGKPLIAYAIETGLNSSHINKVIVSTDDAEIAEVAKQFGAEVPFFRPENLANDTSSELLAWKHAINEINNNSSYADIDIFVSLPPTSPFRSVKDIDLCIQTFIDNDADIVVTLKNASRHPSFNMVSFDKDGYVKLVMPVKKNIHRRQDTSLVYDMTTVAYVAKPEFILNTDSILNGRVLGVMIPDKRAIDIDTPLDFEFAEFLASRLKKKEN